MERVSLALSEKMEDEFMLTSRVTVRWREMAWHMIVKYNDGVIRQEENGRYKRNSSGFRPVLSRPGMTPKSRHRIHQATGTRLEVPTDGNLDGTYM